MERINRKYIPVDAQTQRQIPMRFSRAESVKFKDRAGELGVIFVAEEIRPVTAFISFSGSNPEFKKYIKRMAEVSKK